MGLRSLSSPTGADRTPVGALLGEGWVRPMWMERQLDPYGPSFLPQGHLPRPHNLVDRSWTGIGTIASPHRAVVDPRGLLTPRAGGWSLDWWIGAEDRWHFPSRDRAVRHGLVGTAPVIETLMRVPGGDAVCRAYGVVGSGGAGDLAVMEVENRSAVPFAVGFSIRPYNAEGLAAVRHIELVAGAAVVVDGVEGLYLPRAPSRVVGSSWADGDVAAKLGELQGEWQAGSGPQARCRAGMAQATFVFPLSHTSSIRVALPLARTPARRRPRRPPSIADRSPTAIALPSGQDVARAWEAQTRRGSRFVLPPGRLADALEANRKHMLLAFAGDDVMAGPATELPPDLADVALILHALDLLGFGSEVRDVVGALLERQRSDGAFDAIDDGPAATAAVISAIAGHWRMARDADLLRSSSAAIALASRLMVPAPVAAPTSVAHAAGDRVRIVRGLLDGAQMLAAAGDRGGAAELSERARSLCTNEVSVAAGSDSDAVNPGVTDVVGRTGVSPLKTLQTADSEVARGDRRALDRLRWVVEVASGTLCWPGAIHPGHGGGTWGDGQDLRASAGFVTLVRGLLVREDTAAGSASLVLCGVIPDEWAGQGLEVHDAPTAFGPMSFAVRWHGRRPALLWDLRTHPGLGPVLLRAPGLDATWSSVEPKGEALLGLAPAPARPGPDPEVGESGPGTPEAALSWSEDASFS